MRDPKARTALAAVLAFAAALLLANAAAAQQYCGPYGCSPYPPPAGTHCSKWKWNPKRGNFKDCDWPYHG